MGISRFMAPGPLDPLGPQRCSKFHILPVKIFSLKQRTKQILPATIEKITFLLFKKIVYGSFRKGITIGKCKTKAIQRDLGTFRHNRAYPKTIQGYSGIFRTLCNPGMFRNVV